MCISGTDLSEEYFLLWTSIGVGDLGVGSVFVVCGVDTLKPTP